jgi:hypothetical protein
MSTTTSGFSSFTTVSGTDGSSVVCSWTFDASYVNIGNARNIYLYTNDDANFLTTHVVPLSTGGVLTTSFTAQNLILNNTYLFSAEVTVNNGGPNVVYYSPTSINHPTTTPVKPNFYMYQADVEDGSMNQFAIQLRDASGNSPTPTTLWDGYETLTGVYVIYTINSVMITNYFPNDASNSIYTQTLLTDAVDGDYDVVVTTENINGRSPLSNSQAINITELPTVPLNFSGVETIAVNPAASLTDNSIFLSWNNPTYLGFPHLYGFQISRTDVSSNIVLITDSSSSFVDPSSQYVAASYNYTDASNLVLGTTYTYNIRAYHYDPSGIIQYGTDVSSNTVKSISYPTCTLVSLYPGVGTVQVTATSTPGGSNNLMYDFSGNNQVDTSSNNVYTFSGLTNGDVYAFQVNSYTTSTTTGYTSTVYNSGYTDASSVSPYSEQEPITDFSSNPLDAFGNPYNGELMLTWLDPSNNTIDASFEVVISWVTDSSLNTYSVPQGVEQLRISGLTNGVVYDFSAQVQVYNAELPPPSLVYSTIVSTSGSPFTYPDPVTDLVLNNVGANYDLSYNFTSPSSPSGGLAIAGFNCLLTNLTTGLDLSSTIIPYTGVGNYNGLLFGGLFSSSLFVAGAHYSLTVETFTTFNSVNYYSGSYVADGYTKPVGVDGSNVEVSALVAGEPNGSANLTWTMPVGQDAAASTYNIYRSENSGPFVLDASNVTVLFYEDTIALPLSGNSYRYQVQSVVNSLLVSTTATPSSSVIPFNYPTPISDLTLVLGDLVGTQIDASWVEIDASSGLPSGDLRYLYTLYDVSGNFDASGIQTGTTISFNGLVCGTGYTLTVYSGVVQSGIIYYTSGVSATLYTSAAPVPPTNLIITTISSTELKATWTNSSAPSGLNYYGNSLRCVGDSIDFSVNVVGVSTSYVFDSLLNDASYTIFVSEIYQDNTPQPNPILIYSTEISGTGRTANTPNHPLITATATNTLGLSGSQQGRTTVVNWYTDLDYPNTTSVLTRTIYSPTDPSFLYPLSTTTYDFSGNNASGIHEYVDIGADDLANSMNGNIRTYSVVVTYPDYSTSQQYESINPGSASAIPYNTPYGTDISGNPVDASMCIVVTDVSGSEFRTALVTLSTNGNRLNQVNYVGVDNTGDKYVTKLSVFQLSNITYSNTQINDVIAANQVVQLTLQVLSGTIYLSDILASLGNQAGAFLTSSPYIHPRV